MKGRIHSLESFGTVDGPGTRFVVFVQGCPMRCAYCHNPDTWPMTGGTLMEPEEIYEQFLRNKEFYKNGGITVTGGEPLMQVDFLIDLFTLAKKDNVHTCIDSSGIAFKPGNTAFIKKLDKLMELTDLVMLDIKHIDPEKHKELTSQPNDGILAFAEYLDQKHGRKRHEHDSLRDPVFIHLAYHHDCRIQNDDSDCSLDSFECICDNFDFQKLVQKHGYQINDEK